MPEPAAAGLVARLEQRRPVPLAADIVCAPGEMLALVGPSGAGKSTILRCLAGLHRPEQGRVACGGRIWFDAADAINLPPQKRAVGFVFQSYALFPHLSALANVRAALGHLSPGARRARAAELLSLVHLGGLEDRRPHELSGGQQQRVAVARALARDPEALLLDEPFSAVDQVTRRKLHRELAQLRRRLNIPIVLVTHDLDEACELADRMTIIHHGQTLQTAAPFELMSRPANALVARLVDLPNVFEGEIVEHRPSASLTLLRWRNLTLETKFDERFQVGTRVGWVIPSANVILHRRDRPSRGEHENPVRGIAGECLRLGETTSVTLFVDGDPSCRIAFSVPTHVANRNRVAPGASIAVSLLAEAIHLMPGEQESDNGD